MASVVDLCGFSASSSDMAQQSSVLASYVFYLRACVSVFVKLAAAMIAALERAPW